MPIKKKEGETKNEFVSRCIEEEITKGHEQDQAVAICINSWEKVNMSQLVSLVRKRREIKFVNGDKKAKDEATLGCGGKGCIKKEGDCWKVISNKTLKPWPGCYNSEQDAMDALKAYHVQRNG
jgi:hypothetical protein